MSQKVYEFITASDYTYDDTKIEVDSGLAKLVNHVPINETFYANYNTSINGSRGSGVLTGSAIGGASINGSKLDLAYNDVRYVDYSATLNADSQQTGCIRFKIIPNYSNVPIYEVWFFYISKQHNSIINGIGMRHSTNGVLRLHMHDKNGSLIQELYLQGWSPIQGQEYEFEINYDVTLGEIRVFIDGTQKYLTGTATGIRDENIGLLRIGTSYNVGARSDFKIDDFQIFSEAQHTSNYTPTPIPENSYSIDNPSIYPKISWNPTSPLTMLSFTETLGTGNQGTIGYQISQDAGITWKYWDGSSWVVATSSQYNDALTINTVFSNLTLNSPDDDLMMKVILISDGEQKVELDHTVIEVLESINDLIVNVDFPRQVVKGDTCNIKCQVNQSIYDWKIRATVVDNSDNSIKLANTLSGGSDDEIDIIDQINGMFFIKIAKDLTTDFDDRAEIEIEIENSAGNIFTLWKYVFLFKKEEITWENP